MKVLHVNYYDHKGGASIGVNRLHKALLNQGLDSKILVSEKNSNDEKIIGPKSTLEELVNQIRISLSRFIKRNLTKTDNKETFSFNYLKYEWRTALTVLFLEVIFFALFSKLNVAHASLDQ